VISRLRSPHPISSIHKECGFTAESTFVARSPFKQLVAPARIGGAAGVIAQDRDGLGLATIILRRGKLETLAQRIREHYDIEIPRRSVRASARGVAFLGLGPDSWLGSSEHGGNAFAVSLRAALGPIASVSDQSDGYAVLRLSGSKVRETLAKLIPVDLHPRAFLPGDVASTVASHIGVTLWRLDDALDGSPVFEIAMFRSLATDFWHSLSESAAEFGLSRRSYPA
jgi:sarcosine oxidase subunit gamma